MSIIFGKQLNLTTWWEFSSIVASSGFRNRDEHNTGYKIKRRQVGVELGQPQVILVRVVAEAEVEVKAGVQYFPEWIRWMAGGLNKNHL